LDETLIHSEDYIPGNAYDFKISLPSHFDFNRMDVKPKMLTNKEIGVYVRPYALEFLKELGQIFEIVIFTASTQDYADAVIDKLDPHKELIDHRLYRQHCMPVYGILEFYF
jgi:TFIIF-interacting CTD phosphatase-like protein